MSETAPSSDAVLEREPEGFCRHCHKHVPKSRIVAAVMVQVGPTRKYRQRQWLCDRCYADIQKRKESS